MSDNTRKTESVEKKTEQVVEQVVDLFSEMEVVELEDRLEFMASRCYLEETY